MNPSTQIGPFPSSIANLTNLISFNANQVYFKPSMLCLHEIAVH